jgi:hypothetical protein
MSAAAPIIHILNWGDEAQPVMFPPACIGRRRV